MLATAALAQASQKALYSFSGGDDCAPYGSLISDSQGNLYGTTYGDRVHFGTVYQLAPNSDGTWTRSLLYTFMGGADGRNPVEGLVRDAAGNLYGTTPIDGASGQGTVFEVSPASGGWTEKILYSFTGADDGAIPYSTLSMDAAGNLYGTTSQGGSTGNGVVYKLTPGSNGWTESVLYAFNGANDGSWPNGPLTFDQYGNLYGTTTQAGADGWGTVYKLTPTQNGWQASVLYSFTGAEDGSDPESGVLRDRNGVLYGTTNGGGTGEAGTVFQLRPNVSALPGVSAPWVETVMYAFSGGDDGSNIDQGLAFDAAGNLNGTAEGGSNNYGVVYRMTPGSNGWSQSVLYTFTGGADGGFPESTVLSDNSGNLFGTTIAGGANSCGVVYQVTP
jgi:uncharacterized repeat protein (TIGR03803 family)